MSSVAHPRDLVSTARYRTIDLVSIVTLGVAFGVVYWGWDKAYAGLSGLAVFSYPPTAGLLGGPWLIAGVVGGLVVRRPGAALACELVAASVEALVPGGSQWGFSTLTSGFWQGLGAELVLAILLYRRFGWLTAALAGIAAAAFEAFYEWHAYYADWNLPYKLAHLGMFAASGLVVAGLGGWAITRALARAGALDAFGAGREAAHEV